MADVEANPYPNRVIGERALRRNHRVHRTSHVVEHHRETVTGGVEHSPAVLRERRAQHLIVVSEADIHFVRGRLPRLRRAFDVGEDEATQRAGSHDRPPYIPTEYAKMSIRSPRPNRASERYRFTRMTSLPITSLLSQVLDAPAIETDNEYEHRAPRSGGAWMTSTAMYVNFLRFVPPEGVRMAEVAASAGAPTPVHPAYHGMRRWGYVRYSPDISGAPKARRRRTRSSISRRQVRVRSAPGRRC